jgi:extracellular factor (EF) 3-hydroxypalmitic acid methyl ester biosynthesis protein
MSDNSEIQKYELVDPLSIIKNQAVHEYLVGGQGKAVNYRQERYRVELLKEIQHLQPRVIAEKFEGNLVDFAITGASCECPARIDVEQGAVCPKVWVMIGDEAFYEGRARVAYVAHHSNGNGSARTVVGIHLLDDALDIDRIFWLRSSTSLLNQMKDTQSLLNRRDISVEYKQGVCDMVFLFSRFRSLMNACQRELDSAGPMAGPALEGEMLHSAWARLKEPLFDIQARLDALTMEHYGDREFQQLHRDYTVPLLSPLVADGPFPGRAWLKPLGYAGDYVLMSYLYEDKWIGPSLYGKLMHRYPMEHQMAGAVRNRKTLAMKTFHELVARAAGEKPADEPVRIFGLAAGPAREVVDFAQGYEGEVRVEFTLVDQDNQALGYVNRQLAPLLVRGRKNIGVQFLYIALRQLIEEAKLFTSIPQMDLIYSAGLFDYLSTGKAKQLASKLFEKLAPGGTLLIGNYAAPASFAWLPTYVYDWPLRYRTEADMHQIVQGLGGDAHEVAVFPESTKAQYFLRVVKRKSA